MKNQIKSLTLILFALGILLPTKVSAGVVITEIMYDLEGTDTNREWIEVYNNGSSAIDLSGYKFFEANTNHGLILFEGDTNVPASGYAVIAVDPAKFKLDWPSFIPTSFDSSFSLDNEGEALAIKDANLNFTDQYTYSSLSGGAGDGKTLQLINNIWVAATPTPSAANQSVITTPTPPPQGGEGATPSASSPSVIKKEELKTTVKILTTGGVVFAGSPLSLEAKVSRSDGEQLFFGKYFWNFGDGSSREAKESEKFTHTYFYPGEYIISADYYSNYYSSYDFQTPDARATIVVTVVPRNVSISSVGDQEGQKDFFVELSNDTDYDADLSGWIIGSVGKSFTIPRNTTLESEKKMILSGRITNFTVEDKNTLKLITPQGEVAFDYGAAIQPPLKSDSSQISAPLSGGQPLPNPSPSVSVGEGRRGEA